MIFAFIFHDLPFFAERCLKITLSVSSVYAHNTSKKKGMQPIATPLKCSLSIGISALNVAQNFALQNPVQKLFLVKAC